MSCPAATGRVNVNSLRDLAICSTWRPWPIQSYCRIGSSANMASRSNPWAASRSLVSRSRPRVQTQQPSIAAAFARRLASQPPASKEPTNNRSSIPPIPPSMRPPVESPSDAQEGSAESRPLSPQEAALAHLELNSEGINSFEYTGLKFEEPPMPMAKLHEAQYHMRYRYEEGISQITKLLMRHGKLSKAQNVQTAFHLL